MAPGTDTKSPNTLLTLATERLRLGHARDAVRHARQAGRGIADPVLRAINVGGLLIDAGSDLTNPRLIREAVDELRKVATHVSPSLEWAYHFNLGNGLSA